MSRHRERWIARLRHRLERDGTPRFDMLLITLLTGGIGFLFSATLLAVGVDEMPIRYAIAFGVAYLFFLGLLRLWLRHRQGLDIGASDVYDAADLVGNLGDLAAGQPASGGGSLGEGGSFGGGGASAAYGDGAVRPAAGGASKGDALSLFDADEGVVVVVLVAAAAALFVASFWIVWTAPALFAELVLDAFFVGGLYHRLRRGDSSAWVGTALRRTALPFLFTGALFVFAGWLAQGKYPEARSIGEVVSRVRSDR
jgi:hypothetical protein